MEKTSWKTSILRMLLSVILLFIALGPAALTAQAQNKLGAHFGMVIPLVTYNDGETTSISDNFAIGFPTGITVKQSGRFAFDMEIVPFIDDHFTTFLVHPGALFGLGDGFTFGARAAFEVNQNAYGFTPLLNKSFPIGNNRVGFIEFVLPVRFIEDSLGNNSTAVTAALHVGVGF